MDQQSLFAVIKQYRDAKIPLDGLHIDVPFQVGYSHQADSFGRPKPELTFAFAE